MAELSPGITPEQVAEGSLQIAIETMAEALRRISIQRGHDLREALLVSYGGAGGQHACRLAELLELPRVLLHPLAGVLSAYGLGMAQQSLLLECSPRLPLVAAELPELRRRCAALVQQARGAWMDGGSDGQLAVRLELRAAGSDQGLEVPWPEQSRLPGQRAGDQLDQRQEPEQELELEPEPELERLRRAYAACHRQRYGYLPVGDALIVERLLVELSPPVLDGADGSLPAASSVASGVFRSGGPPRDTQSTNTQSTNPPIPNPQSPDSRLSDFTPGSTTPCDTTRLWLGEAAGWQQVPLWRRSQLKPGQQLQGPALLLDPTSTTVLEPSWRAQVLADGALLLEQQVSGDAPVVQDSPDSQVVQPAQVGRSAHIEIGGSPPLSPPAPRSRAVALSAGVDPVLQAVSQSQDRPIAQPSAQAASVEGCQPADPTLLELYNHRFAAIAEQMGGRLQQSARSVNIRERLDFSCALFDAAGALVANAPHIPVHLGSMGDSVASLRNAVARGDHPPLQPGDVVLSNNPYNGGTHLPDITAITPVFAEGDDPGDRQAGDGRLVAFVACRGHHADVGGITPGSMPAFSRSIAEEGLLLDNVPFLINGNLDEMSWRKRLTNGCDPVRNPDQLLADLQAQAAANRLGVEELSRLIRRYGLAEVQAYMAHVQTNAAEAVARAIARLRSGSARVALDHGAHIQVAVRIDAATRRARVDFSGSSPQHSGNLNAPLAITKAVVLYVFRCLVGEPIPLNAGCFAPIELIVPEGSLLHPRPPAAVVAGNVEISQAAANALFAALGVQAAAQGTMNNLSFGNARHQYYETICGGTGAGDGFAGAAAVQSHMTNSRLTDPEVLESRFPVRLEQFAIRTGSGGRGRFPGGDGVVRQLRFLEPMRLALISGSRRVPPQGLAGGEPGACGRNSWIGADGACRELPGCCELELQAGEALRLETPGGGGYGSVDTGGECPDGDGRRDAPKRSDANAPVLTP